MKIIGIYAGNFQPAHRGHVKVYSQLKQLTGTDTFIATTDRTPVPEAPLNFGEKQQIWVRHGVPASHVVKVEDWKKPVEIFNKFSSKHTAVIFALNRKEIEKVLRRKGIPSDGENKNVWLNPDGSLNYFQPYKGNQGKMKSLEEHGYVLVVDDNTVDGKPISTSNIRSVLGSNKYGEKQKKSFFRWVFGWFDTGLFQIICDKFKLAYNTNGDNEEPTAAPAVSSVVQTQNIFPQPQMKEAIEETIDEVLSELFGVTAEPEGEENPLASLLGQEQKPGAEERRKLAQKIRQNAMQRKAAAERQLKSLQSDLKAKEADIQWKKKEIDLIKKSASSGQKSLSE